MSMKFGKKFAVISMCLAVFMMLSVSLTACGNDKEDNGKKVEVNLFIAASLSDSVDEIKADFEKRKPRN